VKASDRKSGLFLIIEKFSLFIKTKLTTANVKISFFLLRNFEIVNKIYSEFFNIENHPARACVEVSSLPKGVLVEIDCVAFLD